MPIDEFLRAGLPAAVDDVRPDVETDLAVVLRRAGRRSTVAAHGVHRRPGRRGRRRSRWP